MKKSFIPIDCVFAKHAVGTAYMLSALIIAMSLIFAFPAHAQQPDPKWCVSVWYSPSIQIGGDASIETNLNQIHEINPFWYTPLPDGTISADGEDLAQVQAWREAGMTVIPTIFASLWQVIQAPLRDQHIENIIALVEDKNYDGIEIDYEGFDPSTREDFSIFIEQLAEKLHANNRLLAIAVHAKTTDEGAWGGAAAQDWERLAAAVDIFKIMTYDYTNRNEPPGPIAPVLWVNDVLDYAETITDLSKVRMGLPFYGYSWQRGRPPAITVSWESTQNWVTSFEQDIIREPEHMEARIDLDVRGLPKQTVYMADAVSLAYKMEMIIEAYPDLGGIAIWGIGGEDPANWDVLAQTTTLSCMY